MYIELTLSVWSAVELKELSCTCSLSKGHMATVALRYTSDSATGLHMVGSCYTVAYQKFFASVLFSPLPSS